MKSKPKSKLKGKTSAKIKVTSILEKAFLEAEKARQQAYAPYSHFLVGAAIITSNKNIFSGHNVENASYGATVCAERTAIWKAVTTGERDFTDVVVVVDVDKKAVVPPCALCLQVMAEFMKPSTNIWLANKKGIQEKYLYSELLAKPFGPAYLK